MLIEDELVEFSLKLLNYVGQHPHYFGIRQKVLAVVMITSTVVTAAFCVIDVNTVVESNPTLLARKTEGFMTQVHVSRKFC